MNFKLRDFGFITFIIGIFLLPSALFISIIFIIFASIISTKINGGKYFRDSWNFPFLISSLLLILNCIASYFFELNTINNWDKNLNWIGLMNWIPFFWLFWTSQFYLKNSIQKKIFCYAIIFGTIPVLVSGILQFHFKIYGPFSVLNDLIIWFQRPITNNNGLTGLFNNPNYMGAWLTTVWPFVLCSFLISKKKFARIFFFILLALFIYIIILTQSRNAIFLTFLSTPLILGIPLIKVMILITILFFIIIFINQIIIIPNFIDNFNLPLFSESLIKIFTKFELNTLINDPRFYIWKSGLIQIFTKPILGWGAASFSLLLASPFFDEKGNQIKITHTHNLFLELSQNYGLLIGLTVFITLVTILFKSYKIIFIRNNHKENQIENFYVKAFWIATFSTFLIQCLDITYFDGRLSIIFWILFAGIKNSLKSEENSTQ